MVLIAALVIFQANRLDDYSALLDWSVDIHHRQIGEDLQVNFHWQRIELHASDRIKSGVLS